MRFRHPELLQLADLDLITLTQMNGLLGDVISEAAEHGKEYEVEDSRSVLLEFTRADAELF